jgi:hypothetical protein
MEARPTDFNFLLLCLYIDVGLLGGLACENIHSCNKSLITLSYGNAHPRLVGASHATPPLDIDFDFNVASLYILLCSLVDCSFNFSNFESSY